MAKEIERKFLVEGVEWRTATPTCYSQGYLNRDKNRTVRVRIAGESGFLTVKGPTTGTSRAEFDYIIPIGDAKELLALCDGPIIEKKRHLVKHGGLVWEIDEFLGDNRGLVVAEVELEFEEQQLELPVWAGKEVTNDARYFNSNLSTHPFKQWSELGP